MPYGWMFWIKTQPIEECDGIRLYFQNGIWCVCPPDSEPGDASSYIRGTERLARKVYQELLWGW